MLTSESEGAASVRTSRTTRYSRTAMSTVVLNTAELVARNKGVEYRLHLALLKNYTHRYLCGSLRPFKRTDRSAAGASTPLADL
jgi:hypothetical protein